MYKLFLAFRYLRTRRISLLSMLGVAAGVMTLIVVTSIMGGFARDLRARIRGMTAHVTIQGSRAARFSMIDDWEEVARKVRELPEVVAVSPQIEWPVMIDRGPKGINAAVLVGIVPELEAQTSEFAGHMLDSHPPDFVNPTGKKLGEGMHPAIIGANVLGNHDNKDVVFVAAGTGANAAVAGVVKVMNAKDGFEILTPGGAWSGDLARATPENEAAAEAWIRGRPDAAAEDLPRLLGRALELLAYDPQKEKREGFVVVVSPEGATPEQVTRAWNGIEPAKRGLLSVGGMGLLLRDPGREPIRHAWAVSYKPGPDLFKAVLRDLGSRWVNYGINVTTITPRDVRDRSAVGVKPTNARLGVVGVFNSGMSEYDSQIIYVPLESAQVILRECRWDDEKDQPVRDGEGRLVGARVNKLRVKIRDYDHAAEFRDKLDKALGEKFDITTWQTEKAVLLQAVAVERSLMAIILFFIVLVAAFMILATLSMLVTEKTRDIGIMRALGASVPGIMSVFLLEGLIISALGCAVGVGAGALILDNLNPLADWIYDKTGWYPFPKDIYLLDRIPHEFNPGQWALIVGATTIVCLLAALYPAWKAARLVPVEALRYE